MISALLCAAACAGAGFYAAERAQERMRLLSLWQEALERMAGAAGQELPLPEILRAGDAGRGGPLDQAAALLQFRPTVGPEEWIAALPKEKLLRKEERQALEECLLGLWAPHPVWQKRALDRAAGQWREFLRENGQRRGRPRLYRQLGVLGGAAMFILLC